MANNLHFEYSLSVNEKQTQQNLATFMKKTFGTDKNAKLSVPIKLDITTNLTNVDLKTIQDQIDKQFRGKLTLNATVKVDAKNVARQAQAELDRISKGLSLKVGLEIDPSAMKLMLGTVDVIKTLNKEVTKVKENLKDLGKKIEININTTQINSMYDNTLKTAEKIQKVNAQTTEEINEQLAMTKEQLAHQKKLAEEKKKELDIEKEKQANNKKIEESNKKIRQQQQQLNKELKNVEAQISAEKKKAEVLDQQAKKQKSTAKAQEDATKKIEKSTEKLVQLEKERADNQAFLNSKREEEKQLLTNIELNKQEISLLREKIKEMEKLGKVTTTVTKKVSGGATKSSTPKKPTKSRTSKTVVQVDTPAVQATVQATNAVNELENAEKQVTATIEKQADTKVKAVDKEIKAQDKLVQHTQDSAKKIENATNRSYRAEDSKRNVINATGKDKIYSRIAQSEFASSLAGYRIHDVTSAKEQNEYELVLLDTLIKSRNVLTDFNIELKEGVALTEEQVSLIEERIRLIQKEMVDTKELAGSKDKADRQPFNKALKAYLGDPTNDELGAKLDFQAEKVSKIGAMYKYQSALLKEKNRLEEMLGVKIKENAEVEAKRLEMEAKRDERATGIKAKTAENQSNRALNKNTYKDVGDFLKEEVFGFDVDQLDDAYDEYYEELSEQGETLGEVIGEKFNFTKYGQVQYDELDRYIDLMTKRIEEWKSQMVSASDANKKKLQDSIEYAEEDIKYLKMLANSITKVNAIANTKSLEFEMEDESDDLEETTEAMEGLADPKLVAKIRTQAENFDFFVQRTHALNEQTHQLKGEVLAMLAYFDRLNKSTDASNEDWEKLANNLAKYREILGKTEEEINEYAIAEKNKDTKAEETKSLIKASIKQGKEYIKQLQQQMATMDKETEAWKERNKAINVFKQLIKDESISKEKMDEQVLGLYNLLNSNKEKDSGDFKESKNNIKIVRQQAKAEEDIVVKYEKQANALYQILKLKKEGKKVSFDINKLIDSEGRGWKTIAEEQEKSYRKMKSHMIDFEFQNVDMHTKFANGDTSNIFDPTSYMKYDEDAIKTTEDMIKVLAEFSAKAYLLAELQEKMETHKPMQNSKANLDIANATTKAKVEEAQAMDAITAKQKEQIKNEQIHQKWLDNQEIAKQKEPYLKASKELLKRIKSTTNYKKNKDDDDFINSFKNTQRYIDALVNSSFSLQNVVDAFEQLKTYAHETFNMKNETIQKLVEPFVGIENAVTQTTQEMKEVEDNVKDVAKEAEKANIATQEKADAEVKVNQQVQEQAKAQNDAKKNAEATAEAKEKEAKAQREISAELHKQIILSTSDDLIAQLPTKMLNKMYEGIGRAVDKGIKLTKTKLKDIIGVADIAEDLDYSKALGERGRLVAEGRKKKDGVFYNRTDEYKARKAEIDKKVEELEKPLLDVLKIMENELKGTVSKVNKEVKKKEPTQNKTKEINKTKVEQNKLSQQQVQVENKVSDAKLKQLDIAKQILEADRKHKDYMLDIDTLTDAQGRTWKDIYKDSEKVYKGLSDEVLFGQFANATAMHIAYQKTSNSVFDAGRYVDNSKYEGTPQDRKLVMSLMNEFDAKTAVLESLKQVYMGLEYEEANVTQEVKEQVVQQEKVETNLLEQLQTIGKITDAQERFNAILKVTGLNFDEVYKDVKKRSEKTDPTGWNVDEKRYEILKSEVKPDDIYNPLNYMSKTHNTDKSSRFDFVYKYTAMEKVFNKFIGILEEAEYRHELLLEKQKQETEEMELQRKEQEMLAQARQKQVTVQKQDISLEDKKAKIQARIEQNEVEMLGEEEINNLKEQIRLIDEKTKALESQGETAKFLKTLAGIGAKSMAGKLGLEAILNPKADYSEYGITDMAKFVEEQKQLQQLQNERIGHQWDLDQNEQLIEDTNEYRKELDKLNGVAQDNTTIMDAMDNATKSNLETLKQTLATQKEENKELKNKTEIESTEVKRLKDQIKYNEEMAEKTRARVLSNDELASLEEERDYLKQKTVELQKQGETLKFMTSVGEKADATGQDFRGILNGAYAKVQEYGVTDLDKFQKEQKEIGDIQRKVGELTQKIMDSRDDEQTAKIYLERASKAKRELKELTGEQEKANQVDAEAVKINKEKVEVFDDLILGLNATNRAIAGDSLSDLGLAKLEAMLQLYVGTDGLTHASFAGTGKDQAYFDHYRGNEEGLITDMAMSEIPYSLAKYHNLFPTLEKWYKELAELAEVGDKPAQFDNLKNKIDSLFKTITGEIESIIYEMIDKKPAYVDTWDNDDYYSSSQEYRDVMGVVTVDSSGFEGDAEANKLEESVKASMRAVTEAKAQWGKVKQEVEETATATSKVAENTSEVKQEVQQTEDSMKGVEALQDAILSSPDLTEHFGGKENVLNVLGDENTAKELNNIIMESMGALDEIAESKKEDAEAQASVVEDKKEELEATKQLVDIKKQELNIADKIADATQETKEEEKTLGEAIEKGSEDWYKTYVHLTRVVEASEEFRKANLGALEAWEEIKSNTESYESDEQWKEAVDAIKEYAEEMEIVLEDEEKLYQQRQQANAKTSLADTVVGEKKSAKGKKLDKNGVERDTKAKKENTKATNENTKAKQENAKAEKDLENATKKSTKAKKDYSQAAQEMISIPKSTNKKDYIDGTLNAIKKVIGSSTFKKYAVNDTSLKDAINALDKEAKVNKSSDVGIDYWEGLIKRLKELGAKGHVQGTTIDNMLIPYIGGEIPKSKASKAVKEKAAGLGTTSKEAVDNAKKVEKSTQETAKAENKIAEATKVVKVDSAEVAKNKQDEAKATKQVADNKEKEANASNKVVEAKEKEIEVVQNVKDNTTEIVQDKKDEQVVATQVAKVEEEKADTINNIADTQKEIVVITEKVNEINQEELQAMKDELNAKEKLGAEQKAQLATTRLEIKEAEKKEKSINKSIEQENKMIGKMQEKIALAKDAEENAKLENEERLKQKAELDAHISLLQQQADEKRKAIALLETEIEYTDDNTFQIKQLTKEYDKLQENISETQAKVDELTDSYYEQQEQARKANNEASQQMIDEYMKRIEEEEKIRREERAKYLPSISGEVGEYKGGGGGNVPPRDGSDESSINAELSDRIKLRQRELMLQLQQIVYNKDLSDEQKMGVQILAEQILEIGQLASSMKDLNWLTQNVKENMKEFKFSVKVDEDNKKELAKIAEEERKELTNMYASLFDEIDANEKLKAEKQSLEELIALYKEKTLAQVDEYSSKNSGYVDQDRISDLRSMVQYMEKNISSAGEYEQVVRQIGNAFREIKFDTNQTKQWYKMEESAEKARVAKEKEAEAQAKLNKELEEHIRIKREQAQLYAKEILSSSTMRKATEEERQEMERLITQYNITGSSVKEVNQCYAEMQRTVKNMRLDIMNKQLMEQDTWLDKVKNGIKDYVRFTLDLDDIQGVMQNVTRIFQSSFEHMKVLDEAYTNINQTMDVSIEEFDVLAQKAYEVGDASGALGTDILEMMKIYANANETVESLNDKVAGTTAFQNISGLSGTDATNALQAIINQFKLTTDAGYESGEAIQYVGDTISGVAYNLSKDEGDAMREIISAVEDAGSVIESAGGSLEWYSALTGTLAETMNATGSEVGGAMRMITARTLQQKEAFEELNDSGEETEVAMANAEKALTNLGISIRGSDGDLRSIEEVLGDVAAKWDTLSDSDQQFVAEKLAGTNRRTYFMSLMENYERVIELQGIAQESEGNMMEASEKHAESLTGKLNQLTNAKEKFYQTILNSDALKVGTQGLTDLLNSVTKVVEYMDGKWVTALGGATGALIAFKMAKDGLTFGDFIKGLGTTILKFAGLEAGAITATGALTALKSVLLGIAGGAVLAVITGGIVALVNSMKSAEEQIEETRVALENYKSTMADVENDSASLQGMQMKVDKMKELNTTLDDQARLAREVNDELASHADSYGSIEHILRNENIALQDRLDLLDKEIEKRGEIARQAALEALNGKDMFGFGDTVYDNLVEDLDPIMGEFLNAQNGINKASLGGLFAPSTEQIDSYYELWEDAESRLQALYEQGAEQYSLAQKYFEEGIINEEDMAQQTELYEQFVDDLLLQVQRVSGETGSSIALDMFEFGDPLNPMVDPTQSLQEQNAYYVEQVELLETLKGLYNDVQDGISGTELSNIFNSDVMKDFTGDITKTEDVMAHLGQKIAETENEIDALGATSHSVFNEQEKDVAELQKEYIDACKTIEDIEGYMEQIGEEGGVSADMMATLFDSGLLEGYTGALNDAGAIQEHLTSKIAESEEVARQAYLNMMKDDADFWAQKMANSEEWRDHENTVQQDIIGIMANSLGVQAEDFSSFIDSKGGMREVDYTNASTMAEAENTMQSSLATQVLGYAAQLINSKAGYRQTDMGNVNEFLNSQGVAEAKTVQELAAMWADFYNAKVAAINNTMSEINSQIAAGWTDDQIAAMDGWFGDGSLRAKQTELNKLQNQIKSLAATNLTMTNFFAGLDTYFNGAGGGVGQNTVGGGKIGGGGGGNSWKPTSTGGSGYKPSGGKGGSGSGGKGGSGGSGSGGKGGSGSGGSGSSEKEVEDMEAEIDRYYELNDAINDNEKAISQLQSKRDSITTKSAYKKSIEQEVALLNKQIQAYKNLQKEQEKERNEIKKTLSKNGFKFDSNGDISNYAKQIKKLQDQANKKTGTKKEQAIENVEYLIDLIERYDELHSDAIPETKLEIIDLQYEITELNRDLEENMKNIEKLTDRYFGFNQAMNDLSDALDINRAKQEHADEEEKIALMQEEIELMKQQQALSKNHKAEAEKEVKELQKQLKGKGFTFDTSGNITNYKDLIGKLEKQANSLVGEAQDDAVQNIEDLLDVVDKYVELSENTIPELELSWYEYANSIKDVEKEMEEMYKEHQENAVQTQKDIASAYEHYLDKRYNKLKEALNKERDLYNESYDAENFQRELSEEQRTLDEIAQQIAIYERDTSVAGQARLAQLKEEYEAQQKLINEMIRDNEHDKANDAFDEAQDALDNELEALLKPEQLVQTVNDAIASGMITIGDEVVKLDALMSAWMDETGDGLYALGDILKGEFLENLRDAQQILTGMNILGTNGSINLASSNALLNPNARVLTSNSGTSSVSFDAPLVYINGNVDQDVMKDLEKALKEAEQNIYNQISKSLKL